MRNLTTNKRTLSKISTGVAATAMVLTLAGCETTPTEQPSQPVSGSETETQTLTYADGVYTVDGTYQTPGGQETLGVTVTLEDGVIVDVEVEQKAILPTSQKMQADFADHYKTEVVGKNLSEVTLGKVSGSSLTPNGFNDALDQIKAQAQT